MASELLQSFQSRSWSELLLTGITNVLKENSVYDIDAGIEISFEPTGLESLRRASYESLKYARVKSTHSVTLETEVTVRVLKQNNLESDEVTMTVPLIQLPVMSDLGFILDGVRYELISGWEPATGWYFTEDNMGASGIKKKVELRTKSGGKFIIEQLKSEVVLSKNKQSVPIGEFLVALTGESPINLIERLGNMNPFVKTSIEEASEKTVDECIRHVVKTLGNPRFVGDDLTFRDEIKRMFLGNKNIILGKESKPRLENYLSYSRALGLELSRDTEQFKAGEILTPAKVEVLDSSNERVIYVNNSQGDEITVRQFNIQEVMTEEEYIAVVHAYSVFLDGIGEADNRDSYQNKIVKPVADVYKEEIASSLRKLSYFILKQLKNSQYQIKDILDINKDGFNNISRNKVYDMDILRVKLKEDSLAQVSEETNTITILDKGNKISTTAKDVSHKARGIQDDQYGRADPIAASEGKSIGKTHSLAIKSEVDEYGFLTTTYYNVLAGEYEKVNAIQEKNKPVVRNFDEYQNLYNEYLTDPSKTITIKARVNGRVKDTLIQDIRYSEVTNAQIISPTLGTVPYIENDYGKRALMAGNMAKQALPLIKGERPFVTTGIESMQDIGVTTAIMIAEQGLLAQGYDFDRAKEIAETSVVKWKGNTAKNGNNVIDFEVLTEDGETFNVSNDAPSFQSNMKKTTMHEKLNGSGPWTGRQIVLHRSDIDLTAYKFGADKIDYGPLSQEPIEIAERMGLAVGTNLRVLFKSQDGFGFEDAITICEDIIHDKKLSNISVYEYNYEIERKSKSREISEEQYTNQIIRNSEYIEIEDENGNITKDLVEGTPVIIPYMNPNGLPKVGTFLQGGQEIIGINRMKQNRKGNVKGSYIQTNGSVNVDDNVSGTVIYSGFTDESQKKAVVLLATILDIETGDKMSGRHGNKGVIAKTVPREDMPFMEDGTIPDIILNPLGVPSRMNIGQLLEALSGWVADQTQMIQLAECFKGNNTELVRQKADELGIRSMKVYDGLTGVEYDREMYYGLMYFYRLEHLVDKKIAAIGLQEGSINPKTEQPVRGASRGGGQKIGEQLSHSIMSYGARTVLDELRSLMSDDTKAQKDWKNSLNKDEEELPMKDINVRATDQADKLILPYLRSMGITMETDENGAVYTRPLTDEDVINICTVNNKLNVLAGDSLAELHNPDIFNSADTRTSAVGRREARLTYAYIDLEGNEIAYPALLRDTGFLRSFIVQDMTPKGYKDSPLTANHIKQLVTGELKIDEERKLVKYSGENVGIASLIEFIKNYNWQTTIDYMKDELKDTDYLEGMNKAKTKDVIKNNEYIAMFNEVMSTYPNPKDMLVTKLIVLPAGLRPTDLDETERKKANNADILYQELMQSVQKLLTLKPTNNDALNPHLTDVYIALQKIYGDGNHFADGVDISLYKELTSHKNKNAIVRDHILGKRTHFSGRSVITVNPNLDTEHAGIPFYMALRAYMLHLPRILTNFKDEAGLTGIQEFKGRELREFVRIMCNNNLTDFAKYCNQDDDVYNKFETTRKMLKDKLQEYVKDKVVLLNREPSLHKYSIQAFHPIIVDTMSIQICPLVCAGFNADFDGDQMALFFLQTDKAIKEAKELMMPSKNIVNPGNGNIILNHSQDMVMGIYYATMEKKNRLNPITTGKLMDLFKTEESKQALLDYVKELGHEHLAERIEEYNPDDVSKAIEMNKIISLRFGKEIGLPPEHLLTDEMKKRWLYLELTESKLTFRSIEEMYDMYKDGYIGIHDYVTYIVNFRGEDRMYKDTVGRLIMNAMYYQHTDLTVNDLDLAISEGSGDAFTSEPQDKSGEYTVRYKLKINHILKKKDIQKLNEKFYNLHKDNTDLVVKQFNQVKDFAMEVASKSGVSIYLYDFDSEYIPQERIDEIQSLADEVNRLYSINLISEDEKSKEIISLWRDCKKTIEEEIMDGLDRDNNLFIIIDSGSRGSKDQFMETMGMIGIVTDVDGNPFETPIASNYVSGLNPWEYMDSSHITRDGQISTALGTADAGYLTRRMVMLLQSLTVTNPDNPYKQPEETPTKCDSKGRMLTLEYETDIPTYYVGQNPNVPEGQDTDFNKYAELLGDKGALTESAKDIILQENIKSVWTPLKEEIQIKRTLHPMYKSLLRNRYTDHNPAPNGKDILTDRDIEYLTSDDFFNSLEGQVPAIQIYTTFDCTSKNGVCQRCFGKGFDDKGYPSVGHSVGFEAAQAIGEPSNQLTMSRFHSGSAGNSAKAGIKGLVQMIELSENEDAQLEVFSYNKGIVDINTVEDKDGNDEVVLTVKETEEEMYKRIQNADEPQKEKQYQLVKQKVFVKDNFFIAVQDGDEIEVGDLLVNGVPDYKERGLQKKLNDVQIEMLKGYFDIYDKSNIDVHARHFELIVKRQTELALVVDPKDSEFKRGNYVKINDIANYNKDKEPDKQVNYITRVMGKSDALKHGTSPLDAISDQRLKERIVKMAVHQTKDPMTSPIARLLAGVSLSNPKHKKVFKQSPLPGSRKIGKEEPTRVSTIQEERPPEVILFDADLILTDFNKGEEPKDFNFDFNLLPDEPKVNTTEDTLPDFDFSGFDDLNEEVISQPKTTIEKETEGTKESLTSKNRIKDIAKELRLSADYND